MSSRFRDASGWIVTAALAAVTAQQSAVQFSGPAPSHAAASAVPAANPPQAAGASPGAFDGPLRVCADPNNLPFSNSALEGFENRIADLLAAELGTTVEYTWWAQRRGFLRSTLNEQRCDVVLGVPARLEMVATTSPYYRSTYVFVTRAADRLDLAGLDDPRLRTLRIGVQLIGDDGANTPPSHALAARGITDNVTGYMVYGDYAQPDPPARIIEAVARGDIDVALAWGPMAAFFAARQDVALAVAPIAPEPPQPFQFDIAVGVRRGDGQRRDLLDALLRKNHARIEEILDEYRVPRSAGAGDADAAPAKEG